MTTDSLNFLDAVAGLPEQLAAAHEAAAAVPTHALPNAEAIRNIVVLGIQPRWAETGYGYIEFPSSVEAGSLEPSRVLRFREKPDARTAAGSPLALGGLLAFLGVGAFRSRRKRR